MTEINSYTKLDEFPENKEIFNNGFKHTEIKNEVKYVLIGSGSGDLY